MKHQSNMVSIVTQFQMSYSTLKQHLEYLFLTFYMMYLRVSSLNHFQLPLFMLGNVNNTQLRKFLDFHCLLQLRICLNHDAFFMSILFRIVSSLKHFQLPPFMLSKVNETFLRQFLGLYSLLMLRIWLNHDAFSCQYYFGLFQA